MLLSGREFAFFEPLPDLKQSIAVCSALRVYALWNRSVPLSLVTLLMNIIPVAVNVVRN